MDDVWENLIDDKQLRNPISDQLTSENAPRPVPANDSSPREYQNTTTVQLEQNYVQEVHNTSMEWLNDSLSALIPNPDIVHSGADSQRTLLVAPEPHTDDGTAFPHEAKEEVCVNKEQSVKSTSHCDPQDIEDLFAVLENNTTKSDNANQKVWNRPTLMQNHNIEDSLSRPSDNALVSRVFNSESPGVKKSEQPRKAAMPIIVQCSPGFNKEGCRKRTNDDDKAFFDVNAYGKSSKNQVVSVPGVQMSSRNVDSSLARGCQQHVPIVTSSRGFVVPPNSILANSQSRQEQFQCTSSIQMMQSLDQIPGVLASNAASCSSRHQNTTATIDAFTQYSPPTMNQQPAGRLAGNECTLQEAFPCTVPESVDLQRKADIATTTPGHGGIQRPPGLTAVAEALGSTQQPVHQSVDQTFYQSVQLASADQSPDHAVSQTCQLPNAYQGVGQTIFQTSKPLPASQSAGIATSQTNQFPNAYHQSVGQALYQTNQITAGQIVGQTVHQPSHANQVACEVLASQTNQLRSAYENVGKTAFQANLLACGYPDVGQTTYQAGEHLPAGRCVDQIESLFDQPPDYQSTYWGVGHNTYDAVQRPPAGQSVVQTSAQTNQTTSAYRMIGQPNQLLPDGQTVAQTNHYKGIGQPNQLQIVQVLPVGQTSAQTNQTTSAYKSIGQPNQDQMVQLLPDGQTSAQTNQATSDYNGIGQPNQHQNVQLLPAGQTSAQTNRATFAYKGIGQPNQLLLAGQTSAQTNQATSAHQRIGQPNQFQMVQLLPVGQTSAQTNQTTSAYKGIGQPNQLLLDGQTSAQTKQTTSAHQRIGQSNQLQMVQLLPVGQTSAQTNQATSAYEGIGQPNQHQIIQFLPVGQTSAQTNQATSVFKRIGQPNQLLLAGQTSAQTNQATSAHQRIGRPNQLLPDGQTLAQTNQTTFAHQRVGQSNLLPNASLTILPATASRPNVHSAQTAPVDPIALGIASSSRERRSRNQARILPAAALEIEARVQSFRRYPSVFFIINGSMITQLANCGFSLIREKIIQCIDRRCSMKHLLPNVFDKDSVSVTWHKSECRFHSARRPCKHCIGLSGLRTECQRCSQEAHGKCFSETTDVLIRS